MKTVKHVKQIEANLDFLLTLYDKALAIGDEKRATEAVKRIEHEIDKLREVHDISAEIQLTTLRH